MNKAQNDYINKDFSLDKKYSLTRGDFEYFPCPMVAITWTDEQMQNLANEIHNNFIYDDSLNEEENEMYWYETIETCAVRLGMEYYESLTDEEIAEIDKFWEDIE